MKKNIEAFMRYHQAKESLAEYTQIGAAAIQLLKLNVSVKNGSRLLGQFVDACEVTHWGEGKRFPNPVDKTQEIGEMLCNHVLVQQISAFDLFSKSVLADFVRFSDWARKHCPQLKHEHTLVQMSPQGRWVVSSCCNEVGNKLTDLKSRLSEISSMTNWKISTDLVEIEPLFHLARLCRNRIAHSDGIVGSELEDFAKSREVLDAHNKFREKYARAELPPLPNLIRGNRIVLSPENSIYFGAVLYEFAKSINIYMCEKLTEKEFVEMGFFYSCLVETHSGRVIRHRDAVGRINYFLTERYLFKETSKLKEVSFYLKDKIFNYKGKDMKETTYWKIALARHEILHALEKPRSPATKIVNAKRNQHAKTPTSHTAK
ncbi:MULTISPECIES: hypothetical protein [unclassified Janthinobacterium]|uniref:hypothetical protein n=1 Tax=unclassified Janthinobacterium TaxID=2610881 RepID=UPI00088F0B53|nr:MULTISPECIES: hypothetical protein [unclassified Janthinobacterium]SDA53994.1 hypothetical protein SAMN03159349_01661 [Janthinobacterium sp. 551a]SFB45373.1 hypothetical protein SAMN03159300_10514 [Janthinobacterium sp. 344]